ncbi:MAG: cell division protein ZapA [Bacteroidaceae bacterium]|nr:cell division protein ZapA [Bacteroidaceae bacterium]
MDNEKMKIKLQIAQSYYPMTIIREDEWIYREAARRINDKLNQYREHFPNLDMEKYMTMIALDFSIATIELEKKNDVQPYKEKIEDLTSTLESYLKNKG